MRAQFACADSWRALLVAFVLLPGLAVPRTAQTQSAESPVSPSVRALGDGPEATPGATQRKSPASRRTPKRTPVRTARAATLGSAFSSPRSAEALNQTLGSILHSSTRSGQWGVLVMSVTRGDTLYAEQPDRLLKPASTMKLMTTAVALEKFGPDHTFETRALTDNNGGKVIGNLYLQGGGDPTLSLRFWQGESPMDVLAKQIAAAGVERIGGDVIADESAFDSERIPVGWKSSYLMSAYAAPVSALSLNENVVWVVTRPGDNNNALVELDPPSTAIPLTSTVKVVGGSGGRILARYNGAGIQVSGTIGAQSGPRRYGLVVHEPPVFAAGALLASLEQVGVKVDGTVRAGVAPANAVAIAELHSLPLANIVSYMNRESINHFAELLFRDAAHESGKQGTARNGLETLREFLVAKTGARRDDIRVADGSGLSEADSLTARTMVQLLSYAHHAPWGSTFHASLPVAGESELLRRRMRATPAQGNLHAKTGTTNSVISLAGYVTALNGEVLAFAFIYNGADRWSAKSAMDRMGPTLANFHRD